MGKKTEDVSLNDVVVEVGNWVAVSKNGDDRFMEFWNTFWDGLQHHNLSVARALEQAMRSAVVNQDQVEVATNYFFRETRLHRQSNTSLNALINDAANQALVEPKRNHDRYGEGWNAFWTELRSGASPHSAINTAFRQRSVDYQREVRAIGTFINRYRSEMSGNRRRPPRVTRDDIQSDPDRHPTAYSLLRFNTWLAEFYASHISGPHGQPRPQHAGRHK